ncbi:DUF2188 domain-containing protein [Pseudomonas sp. RIT-PI-S]|uniref:DUF2188 domain-containing protein n=1 Tax=Pseudomonas sp. RIT-PI-S TaxID=3035295 RepID=UPI0021D8C7F5|nr:DUF2188 domain-containing protein [Pseudomonas sp. RIT-PI-S]
MDTYQVTHKDDHWELKKQGASRASHTAPTKEELLKKTADYMQGKQGSVKIHKLDGTFEEERTYPRSADPRSTKG